MNPDFFLSALEQSFTLMNIFMLGLGVVIGIIIGILPGFGPPLGIALALPFTYYLSPVQAFSLLLGIYNGAMYGGSITAVLIGVPGTSPAAATVLDGHPMLKNGRGAEAMNISLLSSVFGGLFSTVALIVVAPFLARFAMSFGPAEYFALGMLGITVVGKVSGSDALKGIFMGALGILLTTVGIDPVSGQTRYTFDIVSLYNGIPFIPLLVGLFAVPEMLLKAENPVDAVALQNVVVIRPRPNFRALIRHKALMLRSSVIGTLVGIMPGGGGDIAAFLSYGEARRISKTPEKFGQGMEEGVVAAEAANNATIGGALIPALTLGVPGSAAAAVLLGAFMVHGMTPGPRLFQEEPVLMYSVFVGLFLINLMLLAAGFLFIRRAVAFMRVPVRVVIPLVILLCFVGSYSAQGSMYGVWVMLISGVLGYVFVKRGFPVIPCVLGVVLGPLLESSFRQALTLSDGDLSGLFVRPISLGIYALMLFNLFGGPLMSRLAKGLRKGLGKGQGA